MSYIYLVNNLHFKISFANDYKSIVERIMSLFTQTKNKNIDAMLTIKHNKISFIIQDQMQYEFDTKTNIHDLYNIINNAIALLYDSKNSLYIHSCVVSNGEDGVLILGDFGSGKSTIGMICKKLGLEINSADQSLIHLNGHKLILDKGSRYLNFGNKNIYLEKNNTSKKINILYIIFCIGICYNGSVQFDKIKESRYFVKKMYDRSSFHFKYPLLSNDKILPSSYEQNLKFINKISQNKNIKKFIVRGDPDKIAYTLLDMINNRR